VQGGFSSLVLFETLILRSVLWILKWMNLLNSWRKGSTGRGLKTGKPEKKLYTKKEISGRKERKSYILKKEDLPIDNINYFNLYVLLFDVSKK
jgi:hypothetical protein